MKNISFWKTEKVKPSVSKPKLKLPKTKNLVKTAIGGAIALTALGIGLEAYESMRADG